jgi:hypothetical protein
VLVGSMLGLADSAMPNSATLDCQGVASPLSEALIDGSLPWRSLIVGRVFGSDI